MEKYRKIIKWAGISIAVLAGGFLLLFLSLGLLLPEDFATRLVKAYTQENVDAQVDVRKISLSTFRHFPYVGLELDSGNVVTGKDTLLSFGKFTVYMNPIPLLVKDISIKKISLQRPRVHAYVDKDGRPNWDILREKADTVQADTTGAGFNFDININGISIQDQGHFVFESVPLQTRATLHMRALDLKGNFSTDLQKIRVKEGDFSKVSASLLQKNAGKYLSAYVNNSGNVPDSLKNAQKAFLMKHQNAALVFTIDTLNISASQKRQLKIHAKTRTNVAVARSHLAKDLPLDIDGRLTFGPARSKELELKDIRISVADIPLVLNGQVRYGPDSLWTDNLTAEIKDFPLKEFIRHLPDVLLPDVDKVETDTRLRFLARISGTYNMMAGTWPQVRAEFGIPHSSFGIRGRRHGIKDLYARGTYSYIPGDSNIVQIENFIIDGDGIRVKAGGAVSDLAGDPFISLSLSSYADMDSLMLMLPKETGFSGKGKIDGNLSIRSRASNLSPYRLAKTNIRGSFQTEGLDLSVPEQDIFCHISNAHLNIGSGKNETDTTIAKGTRMIGLDFKVDSTYIRYKDSLVIRGRGLRIAGHNEASLFDTTSTAVKPFNGSISARIFEMDGTDSTRMKIRNSVSRFSILPYKGDMSVPSVKMSSDNRRIELRQYASFIAMNRCHMDIFSFRNDRRVEEYRAYMRKVTDSLQVLNPQTDRDTLARRWLRQRKADSRIPADDFSGSDFSLAVSNQGLMRFLDRWEASCNLKAGNIRITTPLFPLKNRIKDPDIYMDLNELRINGADMHVGHSVFHADGSIKGIRQALRSGSKVKAELNIVADTLNFNELVRAATLGGEYMAMNTGAKDSLMLSGSEDELQEKVAVEGADTLSRLDLVIVPNNIDADIRLNVNYGIYSNVTLSKAEGHLQTRNRCLQITDFKAATSAGEVDMNAFYRTRSKKDINAGFDLNLRDIDVKQFIALQPEVDSLLPMLKSFEGILNCKMAATADLDTNMNIILPTLNGVASLKGENLVLLDGETFAEIAKMLKFKNRERNLVNRIAVELNVKDNKVEIYPFLMEMDRYKTAISGTQGLDMTFDYHISVIKSPIPIRVGLNVSGNLDDVKFKIGKCKYKSENIPVYTHIIDSTTMSLREYIRSRVE